MKYPKSSKKGDPYLQAIVRNLEPSHVAYKDSIRELDNLAELLQKIKKVERIIEKDRVMLREQSEALEIPLNQARDSICDILNKAQNRDLNNPLTHDFERVTVDFVRGVREVSDGSIFPFQSAPRSSRYIPPLIQRTSKKLGNQVIKAMTSGTKYRNYTSMASWQRNKYNRRIMFIAIAWGIALTGLILSIGFLTRDFITAQRNLAVQVERTASAPLRLPAITICSDEFSIPPFADYPTKEYPGTPIFMIGSYIRCNRSSSLPEGVTNYPDILPGLKDSPVELVFVTDEESSKCEKIGFDVRRETEHLSITNMLGTFSNAGRNMSGCKYCFRIGQKQRQVIQPTTEKKSVAEFSAAIEVIVSKSRLFGICQTTFMANSYQMEIVIAKELYKHAKQLEERGILDFNGHEYTELLTTNRNRGVRRFIEFYCNTYFFAGYFYPVLQPANISYKFTGNLPDVWEKTGTGPYFSPFIWEVDEPFKIGPNREVIEKDTYGLSGLRLYAEDADEMSASSVVSPRNEFGILELFDWYTIFTFRKMSVLGKTEYRARKISSNQVLPRSRLVDYFRIGFDFEIFEVERVYNYATMSWSEFVTDLFEFIGLFTGICIFTLIVAPAHRIKRDDE